MNALMRKLLALMCMAALILSASITACADVNRLPDVTADMSKPGYWADKAAEPDAVLADADGLNAIYAATLELTECHMTDLAQMEYEAYDGGVLQRQLLQNAMRDLLSFMGDGNYGADGQPISLAEVEAILESIEGADTSAEQQVRYGICVELADVRAVPSDMIITDAVGDIDYDSLQMSNLRVNEPVVVKSQTADGSWFYCDSFCLSGWVPARNIAICKDRAEWLNAWQIPQDELLVVTQSKLYLDRANVNSASSERMLTMGTTLRRVSEDEYDRTVTNRAAIHNYAVWLPVRDADGNYTVTIALIPERYSVSEGYLPLTVRNTMNIAFSALGDAYGWGGMLAVPDCSLFMRNIYKCFGLELPRNTTWQSAMSAQKYPLADMTLEEKAALLDTLRPGTILFFRGHEMMYLGEVDGKHYVISTASSMMAPEGGYTLRLRNVAVNTLEGTRRANGRTWLEDLNLALIPYMAEGAADTTPAGIGRAGIGAREGAQ